MEVSKAAKPPRSDQAKLSNHWNKYHRRARDYYIERQGGEHPDPNFQYIQWLYDTDPIWADRMVTRDHEPGVPEVNPWTIAKYYRGDMACCYPHKPEWYGKPMRQPHSGVRVPKRALEDFLQTVRVSGGDAVTEIRPSQNEGMRAVVARHNLTLGSMGQGRRGFVEAYRGTIEAQPIAPSPVATWNDPHGSWGASSAPAPQPAPAGSAAPPSNYTQGGSSGSADGWAPPGGVLAPAPAAPDFVCPICNGRTPRNLPNYDYCRHCQGFPWRCWNWWCGVWNPPQQFPCWNCQRTERPGSERSQWGWGPTSRAKRRR